MCDSRLQVSQDPEGHMNNLIYVNGYEEMLWSQDSYIQNFSEMWFPKILHRRSKDTQEAIPIDYESKEYKRQVRTQGDNTPRSNLWLEHLQAQQNEEEQNFKVSFCLKSGGFMVSNPRKRG